jgi:hypothetical protein
VKSEGFGRNLKGLGGIWKGFTRFRRDLGGFEGFWRYLEGSLRIH